MPENPNNVSYRFSRGSKYSVIVTIIQGDHCIFSDMKYPPDTPSEIVERLLDDAERAAFKELEKDKWTG